MKRIQMLKASIVALAVGGAFVSKANSKIIQTRFTLSTSQAGSPCTAEAHTCSGSGANCTVGTKTYYLADVNSCNTTTLLQKNP